MAPQEDMVNAEEDRVVPSSTSKQSTLEQSGHGTLGYPWCCTTMLASCSHKANLLSSFLPFFPISHSCCVLTQHLSLSSFRLLRGTTNILFWEHKRWGSCGRRTKNEN